MSLWDEKHRLRQKGCPWSRKGIESSPQNLDMTLWDAGVMTNIDLKKKGCPWSREGIESTVVLKSGYVRLGCHGNEKHRLRKKYVHGAERG